MDVAESGALTGELFAVQVKGGDSYRTGSGGYRIPVENHGEVWGQSAVPVIGVVQDPADSRLRWVNLTAGLSEDPTASSVWIDGEACLDEPAQRDRLLASVRATLQAGNRIILSLGSLDQRDQEDAVWECFALARKDARALIALRRIFLRLGGDAQRAAVFALSLCTPHPDVFWTKTNWLPPPVQYAVRAHMRWSVEEAGELLRLILPEEGIAPAPLGSRSTTYWQKIQTYMASFGSYSIQTLRKTLLGGLWSCMCTGQTSNRRRGKHLRQTIHGLHIFPPPLS